MTVDRPVVRSLLAIAFLLGGNIYICRELFRTEYLQFMMSIECTHLTVIRWMAGHFGELGWFPLWYGGTPFHMTYPPLSHSVAALGVNLFDISPASSYHAVSAAFYCLGAVTLYWFAKVLSGRDWVGLLAGVFYSVLSPSAFLMADVAKDIDFNYAGRRLQAVVAYGEGPHIAALTLIPLALVALYFALRKRSALSVWLAALAVAAVPLTNWIGTLGFAIAVMVLLSTELDRHWRRTLLTASAVGALAYAIASPWIPPSNILTIRRNSQTFVGDYPVGAQQWMYLGVLALLSVGLLLLLRRTRCPRLTQFAALYLLWIGGITVSRSWFGFHALPQPERYHLEAEMAAALLLACALEAVIRGLAGLPRGRLMAGVVIALMVVGVYWQGKTARRYARSLIRPIDIEQTLEYQVAEWFDQNMPGARVMAAGSTHFWLNVFANNPQLSGAAEQAIYNPNIPGVKYGASHAEGDGERAALWMRVYGVDAAVVNGGQSRDIYRDWKDPGKFDGILPELWRNGDDVIYGVPRRSLSLAHVIEPDVEIVEQLHGYVYVQQVEAYDIALEDSKLPPVEMRWMNPNEAVVRTPLLPHQLISVQVSWHPGWRAYIGDEERPVRQDALGQMVIEPRCDGECEIRLRWSGGAEMVLARVACGLGLLVLPLVVLWRRKG
jgi:hypothetical protein